MSLNDERPNTRVRLPDDESPGPPSGRPRWLGFVSVLAVIGLLVALIAFIEHSSGRSGSRPAASAASTREASTPPTRRSSPGMSVPPAPTEVTSTPFAGTAFPDSTADSVPVGYQHNAAGAESAAVNYAVAYGSPAMAVPTTRHAVLAAIVAPNVRSALSTRLDSAYGQLDTALGLSADGTPPKGQRLVMRMLPVGASLLSSSSSAAVVSVWVDSLSGLSGDNTQHPVQEQWETLRITVNWTGNDWKWVGFNLTLGPTPVNSDQAASSNQVLQNATEQFGGLRYAP